MYSCNDTLAGGLPHSDIHGSTPARGSPWLFAACHVLHRLLVPRHPPNALLILDIPIRTEVRTWMQTPKVAPKNPHPTMHGNHPQRMIPRISTPRPPDMPADGTDRSCRITPPVARATAGEKNPIQSHTYTHAPEPSPPIIAGAAVEQRQFPVRHTTGRRDLGPSADGP